MDNEEGYYVIHIHNETDDSSSDDDIIDIDDSDSETIDDTVSDDNLPMDSPSQDDDDNNQQPSEMEHEASCEENQVNQPVPQMPRPQSARKRTPCSVYATRPSRRPTAESGNFMENLRVPPSYNEQRAAQGQGNPAGACPQPMPHAMPENAFPGLNVFGCYYSGFAQNNNGLFPNQPAGVFLQPQAPLLVNNPGGMSYPFIWGIEGVNTDIAPSIVYLPSNLVMPGLGQNGLINNFMTMNDPTFGGNYGGQDTIHSPGILLIPGSIVESHPGMMHNPHAVGGDIGQHNPSSHVNPMPPSDMPVNPERTVGNSPMPNNPVGRGGQGPGTPSRAVIPNVDMPVNPERTVGNSPMLNNPFGWEGQGPSTPSRAVIPNVDMPVNPEHGAGNNPQKPNNPVVREADKGQETTAPSHAVIPNVDTPVNPENTVGNSPAVVEADRGQEPTTPSHIVIPNFAVLNTGERSPQPVNNNLETYGSETVTSSPPSCPPCAGPRPERPETSNDSRASVEDDSTRDNNLPSVCVESDFGYLGDPRRDIKLHKAHLMIARNKAAPNYAASYLVTVLFSEETLLFSSVRSHAPGCVPLDRNKLAAIREYLASVFPKYDLREQGKDWKTCLTTITTMIKYLYAETEIPEDRNPSIPLPENWYSGINDNGGEVPSLWFQQMRSSITNENGVIGQSACANVEGTDDAAISSEMVNLGHPSRNVHMLQAILNIAKKQARPEQAAKYLILYLYPEEILIGSTVYGNLECGLFALDSNRIEALREFLQEHYAEYDLYETGYYWKVCVTAINSCLQILRRGPQNFAAAAAAEPQ